jgi:hypothetical protein
MVTRPHACLVFALFPLLPAYGAVDTGKRAEAFQPASNPRQFSVLRPAQQSMTARADQNAVFSPAGSARSFTVLRPAQAVVVRPASAKAEGGGR